MKCIKLAVVVLPLLLSYARQSSAVDTTGKCWIAGKCCEKVCSWVGNEVHLRS